MKKKFWRSIAPLALVALAGAGLAGCSGSETGASGGKVTITVGNEPTSDQTAALKVYKKKVADFEKANPNIKVNTTTTGYDAQTFQALVASGKMPDVISVPFTDIQSLIARGQVADITSEIKADPQASKVNPTVAKVAQAGGKTYGAAIGAYTMALIYNRALFTKAGLDPNKPPTNPPPKWWCDQHPDATECKQQNQTGPNGF